MISWAVESIKSEVVLQFNKILTSKRSKEFWPSVAFGIKSHFLFDLISKNLRKSTVCKCVGDLARSSHSIHTSKGAFLDSLTCLDSSPSQFA